MENTSNIAPEIQSFKHFEYTARKNRVNLSRKPLEILQVNIGKLCNQACLHCHVEAGPNRTEIMERATMDRLLKLLENGERVQTIDITGGAPEMNPHFKYFVTELRKMNREVIDRCNLTVLATPNQEETAEFLAREKVQIIASLPCYTKDNVEKQRGNGVFSASIDALQKLNQLGYGKEGTGLKLNLVYNPGGAFLPPSQESLKVDYQEELKEHFDIDFNDLFTITNMPIKRFLHDLQRSEQLTEYMQLLIDNFNPVAAENVMCRTLISVGWDGRIYDCDFNQMLEISVNWKKRTIWDIHSFKEFDNGNIAFANHCYGCSAGSGSSCGGALTE